MANDRPPITAVRGTDTHHLWTKNGGKLKVWSYSHSEWEGKWGQVTTGHNELALPQRSHPPRSGLARFILSLKMHTFGRGDMVEP